MFTHSFSCNYPNPKPYSVLGKLWVFMIGVKSKLRPRYVLPNSFHKIWVRFNANAFYS